MELLDPNVPVRQIRPRFRISTEQTPEVISAALHSGLTQPGSPCIGEAKSHFVMLKIPEAEAHYWSPQLHITFEETETEGTLVRGLYGPRPAVWTLFVFFYAALIFAATVIGVYGLSLIMVDEPAGILWAVPILIFIFFSLYHVAYIGKKKGYAHSEVLHSFFEKHTGLHYESE